MSQGEIVICVYRPREGKAEALEAMLQRHVPTLRRLELATDRPAILARAEDGSYVEIFEWADGEAADRAHHLPAVAEVWEGIGQLADVLPITALPGVQRPFVHFKSVW